MSLEEYLDAIDKNVDNKLLLELNTLAMRKRISRLDKLYGDTLKNLYRLRHGQRNGMTKFLSVHIRTIIIKICSISAKQSV